MYDRQQMSLLTSNIADKAFRRNQTAIRALNRFDTKIWDDEAMISGSFDKVESQPMLMQAVTAPASTTPTSSQIILGKYPICAASMGPTSGPAPAIAAK